MENSLFLWPGNICAPNVLLQHEASVRREVVSYNAAISSCEKGEQWACALFLFDAMPAAETLA